VLCSATRPQAKAMADAAATRDAALRPVLEAMVGSVFARDCESADRSRRRAAPRWRVVAEDCAAHDGAPRPGRGIMTTHHIILSVRVAMTERLGLNEQHPAIGRL
jgi:hypothetical protein